MYFKYVYSLLDFIELEEAGIEPSAVSVFAIRVKASNH
jgi:hypothetical protein